MNFNLTSVEQFISSPSRVNELLSDQMWENYVFLWSNRFPFLFSLTLFSHSHYSQLLFVFTFSPIDLSLRGLSQRLYDSILKRLLNFATFYYFFPRTDEKVRLDAGRKSIKLDSWIRKWSFSIRILVCLCSVFWIPLQLTPTQKIAQLLLLQVILWNSTAITIEPLTCQRLVNENPINSFSQNLLQLNFHSKVHRLFYSLSDCLLVKWNSNINGLDVV